MPPTRSSSFVLRAARLLASAAALAVSLVSCAPSAPPPPSMVIVVIDTLRADHLGLYGYQANPTTPNLDARAPSAAVFERAFSTAPWTLPAFGSLLSGHLPMRHSAGVKVTDVRTAIQTIDPRELAAHESKAFYRLDETLPTLATALQAAGYRTGAIMNNAFLSPEFGLQRGFDSYDYDPDVPDRGATVATDLALQWLRDHDQQAGDRPFLLLVHYFDPHMPYRAPEPFLGRFAEQHADERFGVPLEDIRRLRYAIRDRVDAWQRYMALEQAFYDEEIAYADHEIERLFAALDERGFLEDGYVLLTSDHGEEFHDHGWVEHGRTVFNEVIRVPLMVWGPGVQPGRYALPASLVDVMPTLLEVAGVVPEVTFEGVSLWPALQEGPAARTESVIRFDRSLIAEGMLYGDEKKALLRWPWKLYADIEDEAELLFNLELDPEELAGAKLENLGEEGRDRLLAMLAELQVKMVQASAQANTEGASLSEATLERLRALGYIR